MAKSEKNQATETSDDAGNEQVQSQMDTWNEQGYIGQVADQNPNEAYTVKGVTSGDAPRGTRQNDPNAVYSGTGEEMNQGGDQ